MAELTREELASMLAKLDEVMRQAQKLAAHIKVRMADENQRNAAATNWSIHGVRSPRRKRRRS